MRVAVCFVLHGAWFRTGARLEQSDGTVCFWPPLFSVKLSVLFLLGLGGHVCVEHAANRKRARCPRVISVYVLQRQLRVRSYREIR